MMNCRSILPICVVALVLCVCVSAESPESAANSVAADVASLDTRLAQEILNVKNAAERVSGGVPAHVVVLLEPARPNRFGNEGEVHLLTKGATPTILLEQRAAVTSKAQAKLLQRTAQTKQAALLQEIQHRFADFNTQDMKQYWGINMLALDNPSAELVSFLQQHSSVHRIVTGSDAVALEAHAQKLQQL